MSSGSVFSYKWARYHAVRGDQLLAEADKGTDGRLPADSLLALAALAQAHYAAAALGDDHPETVEDVA